MTPNNGAAMQRQMVERAKQELKALDQQRNIAEQGIEMLTNVAAELGLVDRVNAPNDINAILSALVALCSIRLLELQTGHASASERIPVLETFIKQSESGLTVPQIII